MGVETDDVNVGEAGQHEVLEDFAANSTGADDQYSSGAHRTAQLCRGESFGGRHLERSRHCNRDDSRFSILDSRGTRNEERETRNGTRDTRHEKRPPLTTPR